MSNVLTLTIQILPFDWWVYKTWIIFSGFLFCYKPYDPHKTLTLHPHLDRVKKFSDKSKTHVIRGLVSNDLEILSAFCFLVLNLSEAHGIKNQRSHNQKMKEEKKKARSEAHPQPLLSMSKNFNVYNNGGFNAIIQPTCESVARKFSNN